mmetsp:Transcript_67105/g.119414  ORF Transcript_67105/g.119414 Transcript_67105/m.119414 type:complete len:363 (+) Transcript_67105:53-1141(+)
MTRIPPSCCLQPTLQMCSIMAEEELSSVDEPMCSTMAKEESSSVDEPCCRWPEWPGAVFHFWFVEMQPVYCFYVSCLALMNSQAVYMMTLLRDSDETEWCKEPSCLNSMGDTLSCLRKGVWQAMFSFDLNYENEALCTKFHSDNILGYLHATLCLFGGLGIMGIVYRFCTVGVKSFKSGKYLHFSKSIMLNPFVRWSLFFIAFYSASLLSVVLILPLTILRKQFDQRFHGDYWNLYQKWLAAGIFPWFAVLISSYYLLFTDVTALKHEQGKFLEGITFKRSWYNLFMQTNSDMVNKLERRILAAKISGNNQTLQEIMEEGDAENLLQHLDSYLIYGSDATGDVTPSAYHGVPSGSQGEGPGH